jgi:epoxyqueuosine reductase
MTDKLKEALQSAGASLVGYADLSSIPNENHENLPFAVSMAVALDPWIISEITNGPTQRYWGEYQRVNALLAKIGQLAVELLEVQGHKGKTLIPTIVNYDAMLRMGVSYNPETLTAIFPHKTAATLSGLGWIGRCALLVTREYGSAIRLTTVLTDAILPTGKPVTESQCGNCAACVDACPGHAPSGKKWQTGMPRESFFDAFACRKTAYEQAEKIGVRETICGICIAACRRTRKYLRKSGILQPDDQ